MDNNTLPEELVREHYSELSSCLPDSSYSDISEAAKILAWLTFDKMINVLEWASKNNISRSLTKPDKWYNPTSGEFYLIGELITLFFQQSKK